MFNSQLEIQNGTDHPRSHEMTANRRSLQPARKFLGDNTTKNSLMAPLWIEKIILENVFSDQHIVA